MINLKLVRNNFADVEQRLLSRNVDKTVISLLKQAVTDHHRLKQQIEAIQAQRNSLSKQISLAYIKNKQADVQKLTEQMQDVKLEINQLNQRVHVAEQALEQVLFQIPNLPDDSVPIGLSASDNKVLFQSGQIPSFDFTPLNHWDLADRLGLVNFEFGPKLSGTRFVVYQGLGSELYRALVNFTLDHQIYNNGYTGYITPVLLNEKSLISTGQLPKFADDLYQTSDKYLSPTGEVQLVNLYRDQILSYDQLPLKLTTNSLCFRRESGASGKETRGTIRLHQFQKTEIVIICPPEDS